MSRVCPLLPHGCRARPGQVVPAMTGGKRAGTTCDPQPVTAGERRGTAPTTAICMTLPSIGRSIDWAACRPRSHTRPGRLRASTVEVAAAAGVGYRHLAVALGGRGLGVFAGRPADVVVCRDAVALVSVCWIMEARSAARRG